MTIKIGDKLPDSTFKSMTADGPIEVPASEFFKGKTVAVVGLPGAFTGTCHNSHVPGYLEHLEAIKAKGIDEIAIVSVNDFFVMGAWAEATGGKDKLHFLADWDADFTKACGLDIDLSAPGRGVRSTRYLMVVEDGTVKSLAIEENPGEVDVSGADKLVASL